MYSCSQNIDQRGLCFHRYFQAGGSPEHVIQLLSENYSAVAQTVNLLAEWLIQMGKHWHPPHKMKQGHYNLCCCSRPQSFSLSGHMYRKDFVLLYIFVFVCIAGVEPAQVQERVENHLKSLLIKHFDPQKADSIFTVEGEVSCQIKFSLTSDLQLSSNQPTFCWTLKSQVLRSDTLVHLLIHSSFLIVFPLKTALLITQHYPLQSPCFVLYGMLPCNNSLVCLFRHLPGWSR